MQRDLRAALEVFVATHRGLRVGRVFGAPAGFAGRRIFARLSEAGLQLRLPPATRAALKPPQRGRRAGDSGKGGPYESVRSGLAFRPAVARRTASADWITVTPTSQAAQRLEILLEQAARYVALA